MSASFSTAITQQPQAITLQLLSKLYSNPSSQEIIDISKQLELWQSRQQSFNESLPLLTNSQTYVRLFAFKTIQKWIPLIWPLLDIQFQQNLITALGQNLLTASSSHSKQDFTHLITLLLSICKHSFPSLDVLSQLISLFENLLSSRCETFYQGFIGIRLVIEEISDRSNAFDLIPSSRKKELSAILAQNTQKLSAMLENGLILLLQNCIYTPLSPASPSISGYDRPPLNEENFDLTIKEYAHAISTLISFLPNQFIPLLSVDLLDLWKNVLEACFTSNPVISFDRTDVAISMMNIWIELLSNAKMPSREFYTALMNLLFQIIIQQSTAEKSEFHEKLMDICSILVNGHLGRLMSFGLLSAFFESFEAFTKERHELGIGNIQIWMTIISSFSTDLEIFEKIIRDSSHVYCNIFTYIWQKILNNGMPFNQFDSVKKDKHGNTEMYLMQQKLAKMLQQITAFYPNIILPHLLSSITLVMQSIDLSTAYGRHVVEVVSLLVCELSQVNMGDQQRAELFHAIYGCRPKIMGLKQEDCFGMWIDAVHSSSSIALHYDSSLCQEIMAFCILIFPLSSQNNQLKIILLIKSLQKFMKLPAANIQQLWTYSNGIYNLQRSLITVIQEGGSDFSMEQMLSRCNSLEEHMAILHGCLDCSQSVQSTARKNLLTSIVANLPNLSMASNGDAVKKMLKFWIDMVKEAGSLIPVTTLHNLSIQLFLLLTNSYILQINSTTEQELVISSLDLLNDLIELPLSKEYESTIEQITGHILPLHSFLLNNAEKNPLLLEILEASAQCLFKLAKTHQVFTMASNTTDKIIMGLVSVLVIVDIELFKNTAANILALNHTYRIFRAFPWIKQDLLILLCNLSLQQSHSPMFDEMMGLVYDIASENFKEFFEQFVGKFASSYGLSILMAEQRDLPTFRVVYNDWINDMRCAITRNKNNLQ